MTPISELSYQLEVEEQGTEQGSAPKTPFHFPQVSCVDYRDSEVSAPDNQQHSRDFVGDSGNVGISVDDSSGLVGISVNDSSDFADNFVSTDFANNSEGGNSLEQDRSAASPIKFPQTFDAEQNYGGKGNFSVHQKSSKSSPTNQGYNFDDNFEPTEPLGVGESSNKFIESCVDNNDCNQTPAKPE